MGTHHIRVNSDTYGVTRNLNSRHTRHNNESNQSNKIGKN